LQEWTPSHNSQAEIGGHGRKGQLFFWALGHERTEDIEARWDAHLDPLLLAEISVSGLHPRPVEKAFDPGET
jgi:hypothetical protein